MELKTLHGFETYNTLRVGKRLVDSFSRTKHTKGPEQDQEQPPQLPAGFDGIADACEVFL